VIHFDPGGKRMEKIGTRTAADDTHHSIAQPAAARVFIVVDEPLPLIQHSATDCGVSCH
jgi:hypothetical protein